MPTAEGLYVKVATREYKARQFSDGCFFGFQIKHKLITFRITQQYVFRILS